ncbi:DUF3168 domain-containing protein [Shimia sp. R10_1]|uniref:DUF3168 domain-containing protein n=1 Tax=Shimia sp. R10_1 TaxID=2821095 RepID=UPI001ADCBE6B|nr:DUF3168 domain-containing protein [Shimia sp. R10_1]MBO9472021.1 DUF3168 domain-containing protein [Shimia sp. R10_1]
MSYAAGAALQEAVYQALVADTGLNAQVDGAIYDAMPAGQVPALFVSLGAETVRDRSDSDGGGAEHRFVVSVICEATGFARAKSAAVAASDVLVGNGLPLARGRVVFLVFDRATARRDTQKNLRRIDLRFRARIEDDQN